MRWQAVIILLAIALSIAGPPAMPIMISEGSHTTIGTLDVCHSSTPALSTDGDMPCISECLCRPFPPSQNEVVEVINPRFKPFFIALQDERPPKA